MIDDLKRFTNIIMENSIPDVVYGYDEFPTASGSGNKIWELAKIIKQHCQPWLKETDNGLIPAYRGVNGIHHDVLWYHKEIRQDRRTLDSVEYQEKMYKHMLDIVGAKARRHNSIFVSGSRTIASGYVDISSSGGIYVVFPVGDFDITWSTKLADWFAATQMSTPLGTERALNEFLNKDYILQKMAKDSGEFISPDQIEDNVDRRAFLRQISAYISIHYDDNMIDPAKTKKIIKTDNIQDALRSEQEVMIAADSAILVREDAYKYLTEYL